MSPTAGHAPDPYEPYRVKEPLDTSRLPSPVLDAQPRMVELYWKAWEIAWRHVLERDDTPQRRYIDPGMNPATTWVWDSCLMSMYCKYAPQIFPGVETLNLFYYILHDRKPSAVKIHFADNPPLFAWVEWQYYLMTGDVQRLQFLDEHGYLEKHFEFMERAAWTRPNPAVRVWPTAARHAMGYTWRGNTSGMDNTPRGRNAVNEKIFNPRGQIGINFIFWLDLLAQQALSARFIAKIAAVLGHQDKVAKYENVYKDLVDLLNKYYWDEKDGFYYDIMRRPAFWLRARHARGKNIMNKVPTIASYWPMLAGACDERKAAALAAKASDPAWFGTPVPWPSLARRDPEFEPSGRYWRGGVWLPTAYMATKALEQYGYHETADANAERMVAAMVDTYHQVEPHTIWEVYSPTEARPATHKRRVNKETVRGEFCGWSALGPISLLIENVIGFHSIDAPNRRISWRVHQPGRSGIKNLRFGSIITDLVHETGKIHVSTSAPFELCITSPRADVLKRFEIQKGDQELSLKKE
ncbi:MAG: trehalase family glycosidase [Candidatus Sigynarchaeum springense]